MTDNLPIQSLKSELFKGFLEFSQSIENLYPSDELLKIDLHCHDYNSDVPDELLGRILNVPETWIETEKVFELLKGNGVNAYTITNHNNARSCYKMQKQGVDVLTAAEFSCTVPDFNVGIHVLTYGFSPEQEKKLLKLRRNLYAFLEFAKENDIPTIWAHPLYYYSKDLPEFDFFEKMSLVFERFEVLNGQRDIWQNMMTVEWLKQLSPEKINELAQKHGVDLHRYCSYPYKKSMSGGSDSHIGLFAGETGTMLHVPNLKERIQHTPVSELALEAIKQGRMYPYGQAKSSEKLTISLLDYVCQIAINSKDPGLLRIMLHKGTTTDKLMALGISNVFREVQHHKVTMKFVELFHNSLMGKKPKMFNRWLVSKNYKPVFDDVVSLSAITRNPNHLDRTEAYHSRIVDMHRHLSNLLFARLDSKLKQFDFQEFAKENKLNDLIKDFEIPSEIRAIISQKSGQKNAFVNFLDGLSFPFLASGLILAAHFASTKVLFNNRKLLNRFSEKIGQYQHPKRMLWLSDTFDDHNGVSSFLKSMHAEIKARNLPIDIVICSHTVQADDHLIVLKPLLDLTLPMYQNQAIRIPNFLELHQLFHQNEYDRVMCSTEGIMGLAALYLKHAFTVEANFYIHTDWITFGKTTLNLEKSNLNRFRRLLRAFYKGFDHLFVLNTEQQKWLTGREMNMRPEQVHLTAHWAESYFVPISKQDNQNTTAPVILFAGRLSAEKGVMDMIELYQILSGQIPNIEFKFAGTGPAEKELKEALPQADFTGWINHSDLPSVYSQADVLVLPSKFDTFSFVVLEALACGLPVVAYNSKGPKDILDNEQGGYLVNDVNEMAEKVMLLLNNKELQQSIQTKAINRAKDYTSDLIISKLLNNVGLQ